MKTNDRQIKDVMKNIEQCKIQLPDFQRSWVWDEEKIKSLIASIIKNYPVGAAMFLGYDETNLHFKYRTFYNIKNNNVIPEELVLDGQQRLTSMYSAMYSDMPVETCAENNKNVKVKRYYYIDISKAIKANFDILDSILIVSDDKKIKENFGKNIILDLSSSDREYENKMFPVNILLKAEAKLKWYSDFRKYYNYDSEMSKMIDEFELKIAANTLDYKFPVICLEKETSKEAVCQVFENVNTGGVPLTVFELVTAIYAMDDFNLREDWKNIKDKNFNSSIMNFLEGKDFLQACTLYNSYLKRNKENDEGVSCKKSDVLKLSFEDYKGSKDKIIAGFNECESILKEERVFSSDYLPYSTQLIPMAVICALLLESNKIKETNIKQIIKQWYWCGVFGELYGSANETRFANDVVDVLNYLKDKTNIPRTNADCHFNPTRLLTLQTRQSAAYKGIMVLIFNNHCKDLISGSDMDFVYFENEKIDIHHIFPRDFCEKQNYNRELWNSVCNKTPLTASTNREIGGSAPSIYLKKIEKKGQVNNEQLNAFLESHLVNSTFIREDNFQEYVVNRAISILDLIEKATNKQINGRDSEEVVSKFGSTLIKLNK